MINEEVKNGFGSIEINLKSSIICSNVNRVGILYLLKNTRNNEMQAERIAYCLGISHRTALYHLDILGGYDLVEVRGFRKKGSKLMRSVWGLNTKKKLDLKKIFSKINKRFDSGELDTIINGKKNRRAGKNGSPIIVPGGS
jgi:DNA-binding transcriptional ArsR family regulator